MISIRTLRSISMLLLAAASLHGQDVVDVDDRGHYDSSGQHITSNRNYIAGWSSSTSGYFEYRDWFVFDMSPITQTVVGAQLLLEMPSSGFSSNDPSERFELFDVSTPPSVLIDGTGGIAAFTDLGTGVGYGSKDISILDEGTIVSIDLNSACLAALTAATGQIAIGGALTSLAALDTQETVFGFSTSSDQTRLSLQLEPMAAFIADPTYGCLPLAVSFTDLSTGAEISSWVWDFGDGGSSTAQNPTHVYVDAGTYTVQMTVTNALNGMHTTTQQDLVVVTPGPVAAFAASATSGSDPLLVQFTDQSNCSAVTDWAWSFGDSGSSPEANPSHVYQYPGTFSVQLTIRTPSGSDTLLVEDLIQVSGNGLASVELRNGTGVNPVIYSSAGLPVLGTTWDAEIDLASISASGLTFVIGYSRPLILATAFGELLVDPTKDFLLIDVSAGAGGLSSHSITIPADPSLTDLVVFTQGLVNNPGILTNALDLTLGL